MRTEKNIFIAFLLNLLFSVFELFGGIFTNSVAIISDAVHDLGDSISIGISYFLERKSKRKPDNKYTYGYTRYSILGAIITNAILITGAVLVIINATERIIHPAEINYDGMFIFAVFGVCVNFFAAYFTKDGDSLNQKAVNLHMLEDVLGWVVVLLGAVLIKFTKIYVIDSIMSIGVAIFILANTLKVFKTIIDLFLTKTPEGIDIDEIRKHVSQIKNVKDVHHVHIWSMDGINNYATMHIVTDSQNINALKNAIKDELKEHGISHTTIEIELPEDKCSDIECRVEEGINHTHHHHHH